MSVFKKVFDAHISATTKAQDNANAKAVEKSAAEANFATEFRFKVASIARPVFDEFVSDAIAHGFAATAAMEDKRDNPQLSVTLILKKGAVLGANASEECVFVVRGNVGAGKVEFNSYYDQRAGMDGIKRQSFGLASINKDVLNRELEDFLSSALRAQRS